MKNKLKWPAPVILGIILALAAYGYLRAVAASESQTAAVPRLEISPPSFDFGAIDYGQSVEYNFKVANSGGEVLEITRVTTSCACTSAKINREQINPGEEAELKVIYDTGKMSGAHAKGKQERIIFIRSNDPARPQAEAAITAVVE